jgi:hypothetical protein
MEFDFINILVPNGDGTSSIHQTEHSLFGE